MGNSKYLDGLSSDQYKSLTKKLWTIQNHKCFICGEDIDLELNRSEIMALIGPNGSGKTTLMRGITGLLPPRSGRVSFDDRDLFCCAIIKLQKPGKGDSRR